MQLVRSDLILSATDVSGFLACRHLTTLEHARLRGEIKRPFFPAFGIAEHEPSTDLSGCL